MAASTASHPSTRSVELLTRLLTLPPTSLDQLFRSQELNTQLSNWIHSLLLLSLSDSAPTGLRKDLLYFIHSLSQQNIPLATNSWIAFILSYAEKNKTVTESVLKTAIQLNHGWQDHIKDAIGELLRALKAKPDEHRLRISLTLRLLSQSCHPILEAFWAAPGGLVPGLVDLYEHSPAAPDVHRETLLVICNLLQHNVLRQLQTLTAASDPLVLLERLPTVLSPKYPRLLQDLLLNLPHLTHDIRALQADPRLGSPVARDQLATLLAVLSEAESSLATTSQRRTATIQRILAVLPNLDGSLVERIISFNPRYQSLDSGPQNFIEDHLSDPAGHIARCVPATASADVDADELAQVLQSRKNIFDNQKLDIKLLRKGKAQLDSQEVWNDKTHLTKEVRQKIQAGANGHSSSDEAVHTKVFFSDPDSDSDLDDRQVRSRRAVKKVDIFQDDDEAFFGAPANADSASEPELPSVPAPVPPRRSSWADERVLCNAYLADPGVFDRNARGSAAREALKAQMGAEDDLIESWRTNFERNPDKDKILTKHREMEGGISRNEGLGGVQGSWGRGASEGGRGGGRGGRGGEARGGRGGEGRGGRGGESRGGRGGESRGGRGGEGRGGRGGGARGGRGGETGRGSARGGEGGKDARGRGGPKISHDRRVRGRDKKLAHVGGLVV